MSDRRSTALPLPIQWPALGLAIRAAACCAALAAAVAGRAEAAKPAPGSIDLTRATLVLPAGLTPPERKAAQMLREEAAKRSAADWRVAEGTVPEDGPLIFLGRREELLRSFPALATGLRLEEKRPEGYAIEAEGGQAVIAGADARGVLYGAGRLLRLLAFTPDQRAILESPVRLATAPRYPLRGHQLGYRPKTNSYDAWDVPQWEQYIRDLVVFGANAIEGIPPHSDDVPDSPHFPRPPLEMMVAQSRLAQEYGIEYWIWYPALEKDYTRPETLEASLAEWRQVLEALPRVDAIFVPGGDPGTTPPKILFPVLERHAALLQALHPGATLWVSPQGFSAESLEDFYALLAQQPAWLAGVVFGPQQRESLEELRRRVPARYKIRFYPDITHAFECQYPVPDWDFAYAATENREPINPRPRDESLVFRRFQPLADGVLTYSEGCNDDVNKCLWSSLAWDPEADAVSIVRDYARYFIGGPGAEGFAQGLLALEENWRGPLLANAGVFRTLAQFQDLERTASPQLRQNWRFQQALYRAYYDATVRGRLLAETARLEAAEERLRHGLEADSLAAIDAARETLAERGASPVGLWRARVFELAEALFQSVGMQLSVTRYQARAVHRGANLDLIDFPLTDAPWLDARLAEIRRVPDEAGRRRALAEVLNWSNPGPGGFYDDLGNPQAQPHLVRSSTYAEDPSYLTTASTGYSFRVGQRVSSSTYAQGLGDRPLEMFYPELDPSARYRLRVIYGNEAPSQIRLVADGRFELQPMSEKDMDLRPQQFDIPPEAVADGRLRLTWTRPAGLRGNGRGVQVAEVWLIRVGSVQQP
jgi:hypothetical protein